MLKANYLNTLVQLAMMLGRNSVALPPYTDGFTLTVAKSMGYSVSGLSISWPAVADNDSLETDPFRIEVFSKLLEAEAIGVQEIWVSDAGDKFLQCLRDAGYSVNGNKVTWSQE